MAPKKGSPQSNGSLLYQQLAQKQEQKQTDFLTEQEKNIMDCAGLSDISYGNLKNIEHKNATTFKDKENKDIQLTQNYEIVKTTDHKQTSFQAIAAKSSDGKYIVAFRGTQEIKDIIADGIIGIDNKNPQRKAANDFINDVLDQIIADKKENGINIQSREEAKQYLTLTGHSLGGIVAEQLAYENKIKAIPINPYGAHRLVTTNECNCSKASNIPAIISCAMANVIRAKKTQLSPEDRQWCKDHITVISNQGDPLSGPVTDYTSAHLGSVLNIYSTNATRGHGAYDTYSNIIDYGKEVNTHEGKYRFENISEAKKNRQEAITERARTECIAGINKDDNSVTRFIKNSTKGIRMVAEALRGEDNRILQCSKVVIEEETLNKHLEQLKP